MISTDRPGHGLSEPQKGRRLLDWSDNICQIADQLGDRPHSYEGLPFANRALMFSAREFHPLVFLARRMMLSMINHSSENAGEDMNRTFPEVDQKILRLPGKAAQFVADIQEGYWQGSRGPAQDDILVDSAWGFQIEEVRVRVDIWQGALDRNVPLNQARYMHAKLPNSRLIVLDGQAHVYLLTSWRDILEKLIED